MSTPATPTRPPAPRPIRAAIALLAIVAVASAVIVVIAYFARQTLLVGIAPLEQALTAADLDLLGYAAEDIGRDIRRQASTIASLQWAALVLILSGLVAYLVRRALPASRHIVMVGGIIMTVAMLILVSGDSTPVINKTINSELSAGAQARWADLDITSYHVVANSLTAVSLLALVLCIVLVNLPDSVEYFSFRRRTTEDDPRLWTIKPRES